MNARAGELVAALRRVARRLPNSTGIGFYVPLSGDLVQLDAVNGRTDGLVAALRGITRALPGATGVGLHVFATCDLVQITVSTDTEVHVLGRALGLDPCEIRIGEGAGRGRWWLHAASHGSQREIWIDLAGPHHEGPPPGRVNPPTERGLAGQASAPKQWHIIPGWLAPTSLGRHDAQPVAMLKPGVPATSRPAEWVIDDEVIGLREWATATVHPLAGDARAPLALGTADACAIRVRDPARRVAREHARLERSRGRWSIVDAGSEHGLFIDGTRSDRAELRPGLEISPGGALTLIAESPRLIALREALERLLGWSPARRAAIDEALRQVRDHDLHRAPLVLCGGPTEHDLIPIAEELHRLTLTEHQPFVVYNPRQLVAESEGVARTFTDLATALREAGDGTMCMEQSKLSQRDILAVYAAVLPQQCRTHIVQCGNDPDDPELPTPRIVIPPLDERRTEIDRLISEHVREAARRLYATKRVRLSPEDREWLRTSACESLPELRMATLRLVAVREAGTVNAASALLGISHVGLAKWLNGRGFAKLEAARAKQVRRPPRRPDAS